MNPRLTKILRWAVALGLSGAAFTVLARTVDGPAFVASLGRVQIGWLVLSVCATGAYHLTRMIRWGVLVRPLATVPLRQVASICGIGYLAINVIPFRVGELVRPALLTERVGVPFAEGMAATLVERLMDLLAVMTLLLIAIAWTPLSIEVVHIGGVPISLADDGRRALAGAIGLFAGVCATPVLLGDTGQRWVQRFLGSRVGELYHSFRAGVQRIGSLRTLGGGAAWTVASWMANTAGIWLMARAFGLNLGPWGAALVLALLVVGIMLPGPPGFAGVYEAFCVAGLSLQGVDPSAAAAYAVTLHVSQLFVIIGTGIAFLWLDGVSWSRLARLARTRRPDGPTKP